MNDQNETIKDAAVMLSRMTVEVGLLRAQLAAKTSEAERLRETIEKSRLLIEAHNGNEDLNWMDYVDMILFGALAPRDEKPAGRR